MRTRWTTPRAVIALALAGGLVTWGGCLPDFDPPDPQQDHRHHDWDGDGYCEEAPCEPGADPGDCNDDDPDIHPGAEEACDGLDTDCDGAPADDEVDGDGDTYLACEDCDDGNEHVHPGAEEVCDGVDTDCDGVLSDEETDDDGDGYSECEGDCHDGKGSVYPGAEEACDGYDSNCDGTLPEQEADADADGVMVCEGDCDDTEADVYPGAPEACDGLDSDCDGTVPYDEQDGDGDGMMICLGDCDDNDADTYAGAPELCDEVDNDCDGTVDNDVVPVSWYPDGDGDGYGDPQGPVVQDCAQPSDHVQDATDCDDDDPAVNPGVFEVQCDGVDTNCDGVFHPDELDNDGDGLSHCDGDCDDADAANFPGNTEVCDGADNNCDNVTLPGEVDLDSDGQMDCAGDCDDTNAAVHPGAPEICDGIPDNNCDGNIDWDDSDEDLDGFTVCQGDCSDANANSYPGATELCDGLDNDCDNTVPNNEADYDYDGTRVCEGDCDDANPALNLEDMDADGYTTCGPSADCNDYDPWSYPGALEECDGADNNCDGVVAADELDNDGDGFLACQECDDSDATIYPGATDTCGDGIDQDCDGVDDPCMTCMALELDGVDDALIISGPPAFNGLGELTVELWFHPVVAMTDQAAGQVLVEVPDSYGDPLWRLSYGTLEPGLLSFEVETDWGSLVAGIDVELAAGAWAHIAGVFDGEEAQLYLDGELMGWDWTNNVPTSIVQDNSTGLLVGRDHAGGGHAAGKLDEIRVMEIAAYLPDDVPFSPALTHAPDGDTLLLLHLDEGQGNPQDSAPLPHTATKENSPSWVGVCAVAPPKGWSALGVGELHSCGIRPRGTVQCWGDELGNQTDAPLGPFRAVDGGLAHSCGIDLYGGIECWGCMNFDFGQCMPMVLVGDEYVDITAGLAFTCARKADGQVSCWGLNNQGQLNQPGGPVKMVDAGANHACVITTGNTAICWGDNSRGQATVPVAATPYTAVSAGHLHTCAIRDADGGLECWGAGLVDTDCVMNQDCGQADPPTGAFVQVAAGGTHTCALDGAGYATCWGDDSWGQVSDTPNYPFIAISAGQLHTCGVKANGHLLCWGGDTEGQVSDIP